MDGGGMGSKFISGVAGGIGSKFINGGPLGIDDSIADGGGAYGDATDGGGGGGGCGGCVGSGGLDSISCLYEGGLSNGAIPSIVADGTYPLVFTPVDIASFLSCLANSLIKGERFLTRFSIDLLRVRVRLLRRGLYRLLTGERLDRLLGLRLLRSRDRLLRRSCVQSTRFLRRSTLHFLSTLDRRSPLSRLGLLRRSGLNMGLLRS